VSYYIQSTKGNKSTWKSVVYICVSHSIWICWLWRVCQTSNSRYWGTAWGL